jgi:hypothetical protein
MLSGNDAESVLQDNIFHTEYTYIWLLCLSIQKIDFSDIISDNFRWCLRSQYSQSDGRSELISTQRAKPRQKLIFPSMIWIPVKPNIPG